MDTSKRTPADFDKVKWYKSRNPPPTAEQMEACDALEHLRRRIFCVDGPPKSGKTYWIGLDVTRMARAGHKAVVVAPSISAVDVATKMCGDQLGLDHVLRLEPYHEDFVGTKIALTLARMESRAQNLASGKPTTDDAFEQYGDIETMIRRAQLGSSSAPADKWSGLRDLCRKEISTGLEPGPKAEFVKAMQELRSECIRKATVIVGTPADCVSEDVVSVHRPRAIFIDDAEQVFGPDVPMLMGFYCHCAEVFILVGDSTHPASTAIDMQSSEESILELKDDDDGKTAFKSLRPTSTTHNPYSAQLRKSEFHRFLENGVPSRRFTGAGMVDESE